VLYELYGELDILLHGESFRYYLFNKLFVFCLIGVKFSITIAIHKVP